MIIKSSKNLCEQYLEISKLAHESGEPVYITKDGEGDLVVMSMDAFENRDKALKNKLYTLPNETIDLNGTRFSLKEQYQVTKQKPKERNDMSEYDLGQKLKEMYENAPKGDQVAFIHLFGIRFGETIDNGRLSKKEILRNAGLPESYITEISKGVKLAKYVSIKEKYLDRM
jgi:PHD/YefM family antitoxin component YafN of YafNO toxin-antitoxin module